MHFLIFMHLIAQYRTLRLIFSLVGIFFKRKLVVFHLPEGPVQGHIIKKIVEEDKLGKDLIQLIIGLLLYNWS